MLDAKYLFFIYSCKKNLEQATIVYNYLISKDFHKHCQIYIIYGNPSRPEFQDTSKNQTHILEDHHLVLNTPDDYYSLNHKTLSLFCAIIDLFTEITGVFKCDDDIIPNVVHLVDLITSSKLINIDYCGNKVNVNN